MLVTWKNVPSELVLTLFVVCFLVWIFIKFILAFHDGSPFARGARALSGTVLLMFVIGAYVAKVFSIPYPYAFLLSFYIAIILLVIERISEVVGDCDRQRTN